MQLKWRNVPVPEAYLVALSAGGALDFLQPHAITSAARPSRITGALVLVVGLGLVGWCVATAKDTVIAKPKVLLVSGPYRRSRNPMYLAWTLIALGVALLVNSVWLLGGLALAALYLHLVEIPREEARLDALFGNEYLSYKSRVRRYF
jgi:protein-S-isoprenylcysteine O-methyltransferase Ste14